MGPVGNRRPFKGLSAVDYSRQLEISHTRSNALVNCMLRHMPEFINADGQEEAKEVDYDAHQRDGTVKIGCSL